MASIWGKVAWNTGTLFFLTTSITLQVDRFMWRLAIHVAVCKLRGHRERDQRYLLYAKMTLYNCECADADGFWVLARCTFRSMGGQLDGRRRLFVCGVTWFLPTHVIVLGSKRFPELLPCLTKSCIWNAAVCAIRVVRFFQCVLCYQVTFRYLRDVNGRYPSFRCAMSVRPSARM